MLWQPDSDAHEIFAHAGACQGCPLSLLLFLLWREETDVFPTASYSCPVGIRGLVWIKCHVDDDSVRCDPQCLPMAIAALKCLGLELLGSSACVTFRCGGYVITSCPDLQLMEEFSDGSITTLMPGDPVGSFTSMNLKADSGYYIAMVASYFNMLSLQDSWQRTLHPQHVLRCLCKNVKTMTTCSVRSSTTSSAPAIDHTRVQQLHLE